MKPTGRVSKKTLASSTLISSKLLSGQAKGNLPSDANLNRRESRFVGADTLDGDQEESWLQPKVITITAIQLQYTYI